MLQQWFTLSDPELELAIADRRSFERFIGISGDMDVPDAKW
ncbi:transposase, partial [Magnetococcus sp. PR-3]